MQRIATVVMNPGSASRALKLGLRGVCRADVGSSSVDYSKPFKLSAESLRGFVQYLAETSPINVAVGHKFLVCLLDKSIAVTHADFQHLKMATAIWGKDQAAERTAFSGGYLPITSLGNNKLLFFFSSSSTHYDDDLGRAPHPLTINLDIVTEDIASIC